MSSKQNGKKLSSLPKKSFVSKQGKHLNISLLQKFTFKNNYFQTKMQNPQKQCFLEKFGKILRPNKKKLLFIF